MARRLKRDALWEKVLESEIFREPSLFHDGTWWCVSFHNPEAIGERSFITLDRNIKKSIEWLEWAQKRGHKYPEKINRFKSDLEQPKQE